MAKHEITVYQNTGATKETAPYIGSYISKETLRLDGFKAKISERCGLPAIQVQAILAGAFDAIEALEKESLVRVHLDGFTVCGIITGSFPTADAAFNKDKNALQMAVRLDEPIRNALADVTPTVITDASLTKLRVDNVMDLAAPRPYNVIHGKHVFRVAGFNMVLSDEGAEAYLENSRGTKFPLVIDEVVTKQLFKAHTETLLEPGDYKLVVKSKAGDAEGPLQTDYRRVKYLEVIDPEPVIESVDSTLGRNKLAETAPFTVHGLQLGDARKLTLEYVNESGRTEETDWTPVTPSDDGRSIEVEQILGIPHGIDASHPVSVKLYPEGSTELLAELGGITWVP